MKLSQVNEAMEHKITSGSEHGWTCWDDARYLDYESDYAYVSVVYSTKTQTVYQAEVSVKREMWSTDSRPYRWLNPLTKDAFMVEASTRNIDPNQAWDDVKWLDFETPEDFLEKATAIFNGDEWDERIVVPLDLDDNTIMQLALEAHKRDITLNEMVEVCLRAAIEGHNA